MELKDISFSTIDGVSKTLKDYSKNVVLIVNGACNCGFADGAYSSLASLIEKLYDSGLRILIFPSGDFMNQEYDDPKMTKEHVFKYSRRFDLMEKVSVNGKNTHPLFKSLKNILPGMITNSIKWNFTYFLIGKDTKPLKRYGPSSTINEKDDTLINALKDVEPRMNIF